MPEHKKSLSTKCVHLVVVKTSYFLTFFYHSIRKLLLRYTMDKIIGISLDNILRRSSKGHKYIENPEEQEFSPRLSRFLEQEHNDGATIIGFANEGGVQMGKKSMYNCLKKQLYTLKHCLFLESIFFCPYDDQCRAVHQNARMEYFGRTRHGAIIKYHPESQEKEFFPFKGTWRNFRKPNIGQFLAFSISYGICCRDNKDNGYEYNLPYNSIYIGTYNDHIFAERIGFTYYFDKEITDFEKISLLNIQESA